MYLVKPKGEPPSILSLNLDNSWGFKHCDWNSDQSYRPSESKPWVYGGSLCFPIYAPYDKPGYICSLPTEQQVIAFAKRHGIELRDTQDLSMTLSDLIAAYRKRTNWPSAFQKYVSLINEKNREQQIEEALRDHICGDKSYVASYEATGFRLGAKWSDENPKEGMIHIDDVCKWLRKKSGFTIGFPGATIQDFRKEME